MADTSLSQKAGGITITITVNLTRGLDEKHIRNILQGYKIHNADVMIREDVTVDDFIDSILGNRKYIPCLYAYNKIDSISLEEVDRLSREPHSIAISCEMDLNIDRLLTRIWSELNLWRIYTKRRGEAPDLSDPLVVKRDATVEQVCNSIHRSLVPAFKYALVWGKSSRFAPKPQKVGLSHVTCTDDVISVFTKI